MVSNAEVILPGNHQDALLFWDLYSSSCLAFVYKRYSGKVPVAI
jgi:hypothetical protein